MALASSPLRQRPSLLVPFRDGLHRVAPCRHRVLSFAAGNELPHLSAGRGRRGGGGNNVDRYANNPGKYWDQFYRRHDNKFFKDRHYLEKDWGRYFYVGNDKDAFGEPKVVLEVGCGAGNTLFPLLDAFPEVFVHACDISPHAVSLIKSNGAFRHERVNAFVCDVTLDDLCKKVDQSSVDIVTLEKLALKKQRISENFYVRGDGTCVFYFSEDSLSRLFGENGFSTLEVGVYCRQIENRSRKIVMDRYRNNHFLSSSV